MSERKITVDDQRPGRPAESLEKASIDVGKRAGRVALVIGNGRYQNAAPLINPVNDMRGMSEALEGLGFEVMRAEDLPKNDLERQLKQFYRKARTTEAVLLFYAGHAIQVNGRNFLIPVDAQISEETDVATDTIDLGQVIDTVAAICPNTLVFLDACRDNPFERSLQRNMGARAIYLGRGLAEMKQGGSDTFISFATAPGQTASDGDQANSPYTSAMLAHIGQPNVELAQFARRVLNDVRTATKLSQVPWYHSSFGHEFYFKYIATEDPVDDNERLRLLIERKDPRRLRFFIEDNPGGKLETDARIALAQLEEERFKNIARSRYPDDLEQFVRDFPEGEFGVRAKNQLAKLKRHILIVFAATALATGLLSSVLIKDDFFIFGGGVLPFQYLDYPYWWNLGVATFGVVIGVLLVRYFRLKPTAAQMVILATLLGWLAANVTASFAPRVLGMPDIREGQAEQSDIAQFKNWYEYIVLLGSHGVASLLGAGITAIPVYIALRRRGLSWSVAAAAISTIAWTALVVGNDLNFGFFLFATLFVSWQMVFAVSVALVLLRHVDAK